MGHRFSRPVRLWGVAVGFAVVTGVSITFALQHDWDGVAFGTVALCILGGLLAREFEVGTSLTSKFPQAPVPGLLTSVAMLGLVAVISRDAALTAAVAGVLAASNLLRFWWYKRGSRDGDTQSR